MFQRNVGKLYSYVTLRFSVAREIIQPLVRLNFEKNVLLTSNDDVCLQKVQTLQGMVKLFYTEVSYLPNRHSFVLKGNCGPSAPFLLMTTILPIRSFMVRNTTREVLDFSIPK